MVGKNNARDALLFVTGSVKFIEISATSCVILVKNNATGSVKFLKDNARG